ncbi:MAG: DUF1614 domain-containing protein [Clostridia bacterium]|nr:DUF1614 domain-containing protein [Clostridia bacterium]
MPIGLLLLVVIAILVFFGVAHRVLDRLRLSDKGALLFLGAFIIGSFIPDIPLGNKLTINIAGAVIPLILVIYLFVKAGTGKEKLRAILASIVAGVAVFFSAKLLPAEPEAIFIDPLYVYGIVGGVVAYIFGRSRRSAFIAGVLGVMIADIAQAVINYTKGIPGPLRLGGAGVLDATVISGLIAVLLAEVVGEIREKMQGGTDKKDMDYENAEFASMLGTDKDKIKPFKNRDKRREGEDD